MGGIPACRDSISDVYSSSRNDEHHHHLGHTHIRNTTYVDTDRRLLDFVWACVLGGGSGGAWVGLSPS